MFSRAPIYPPHTLKFFSGELSWGGGGGPKIKDSRLMCLSDGSLFVVFLWGY